MKKYEPQRTSSAQSLSVEPYQHFDQKQNNYNRMSFYQQLEEKEIVPAEQASFQTTVIGGLINPINHNRQIQSVATTNNVLSLSKAKQQIINHSNSQPQQYQQIQVKKPNFILKNNIKVKNATFYNGQSNSLNPVQNNDTISIPKSNIQNGNIQQNIEFNSNQNKSITNNHKKDDETYSSDVSGGFSSESDEETKGKDETIQQQLKNSIYDYHQYNRSNIQEPKRHYLEDLPPQPIIDKPYSLEPDMIFG